MISIRKATENDIPLIRALAEVVFPATYEKLLPQGQGVGEQLFRQAVTHVRQEGQLPATIELNVNRENRAVGFYLKMGMHRAHTVDVAIGDGFYMNDYIMELTVEERAKR